MVDRSSVGGALDGFTAQPPQLAQDRVEAPALDILHEVVMVPFLMPAAENRHDIGVVQPGRRPGFPLEPLDLLGLHERARGQDLERDTPAQPFFLGLVNHSHPAATHLADDPKAVDRRVRCGRRPRIDVRARPPWCQFLRRGNQSTFASSARTVANIPIGEPRPAGLEAIEQAGVLLGLLGVRRRASGGPRGARDFIQEVLAGGAFLEMVGDRFKIAAVRSVAKKPLKLLRGGARAHRLTSIDGEASRSIRTARPLAGFELADLLL